MAHQFTLIRGRIEQRGELGSGQICRRITGPPGSLTPADQPIRARESIRVLRLMPNVRQTVALVGAAIECRDHRRELLGIDRRRASSPASAPQAAARPAMTRSWVRDRSNCASAPKTWNRNSPCGVVVSICSVSERNATPRALRSFTVVKDAVATGRADPASRQPGNRPAEERPGLLRARRDRPGCR